MSNSDVIMVVGTHFRGAEYQRTSLHKTVSGATARAVRLTNLILNDAEPGSRLVDVCDESNWEEAIRQLQEWYGAARCGVVITLNVPIEA